MRHVHGIVFDINEDEGERLRYGGDGGAHWLVVKGDYFLNTSLRTSVTSSGGLIYRRGRSYGGYSLVIKSTSYKEEGHGRGDK